MASIQGSDFPVPDGRVQGFAVLGSGSPGQTVDENGNTIVLNTVGVFRGRWR
jgi:hypothetical protein